MVLAYRWQGLHDVDLRGQKVIALGTRGLDEAIAYLDKWIAQLKSEELWSSATVAAAEELRRYAASISPVVTGAYQRSHVVIPQQGMIAMMTIDPRAINPTSGTPVTQYAGPVEGHHHIYQRTFDRAAAHAGEAGVEVISVRLG